ncbi:MAG: enoyl-CoA hydratase/isomerase family protein, partial [Promethearchaeia archaeon]
MNIEDLNDIVYEKGEDGICTITINRPERRNAFTHVTFLEIETALEDMEQDDDAQVLIMKGSDEGNAFSSGGFFDIKALSSISPEIRKELDLTDIAQKKLSMKLWDFSKPIIAAINGLAIGAGITLPLIGADLIYMAKDAWLGFYFVRRAVVPEFSISFLLPFYVGFQRAKEILYYGDKITAEEALNLGFVNGVVPGDNLIAHCRNKAKQLMPPNSPTLSIRMMKKIMHNPFRKYLADTLDLENEGNQAAFKTADFRESTRALKEKRDPEFKGKDNRAVRKFLQDFLK